MSITQARIVHERPDESPFLHYQPRTGPLELQELLGLVATLNDAGYGPGDVLAKVDAISTALDTMVIPDPSRYMPQDLIDRAPAEVADLVRQAGIDRAAQADIVWARDDLNTRLARDGAASLLDKSDAVITAMRSTFDPALAQVRAAADAGLTPHTDTGDLLASANTATLKAYRGLIAAVPVLDGIASLRMQMATIAGIGSPDLPVANFLGSADSELVLEGAAQTWRGEVERVQYDLPGLGGTTLPSRRVPGSVVGGSPWSSATTSGCRRQPRWPPSSTRCRREGRREGVPHYP